MDLDEQCKYIISDIIEAEQDNDDISVIYIDKEISLNNIREDVKKKANELILENKVDDYLKKLINDGKVSRYLDDIGFLHYPETSQSDSDYSSYKSNKNKKSDDFNIILYKETHPIPARSKMVFKKTIKKSIYIPLTDKNSIDLSVDNKSIKIKVNTETPVEFIRDNKNITLVSKDNKKEDFFSIQPQDKSKYFHYKEYIDKTNKLTIDIILSDNKEFKNGIEVEGVSKIKRVGWAIDSEFYSDPSGDYIEGYDGEKYCKHAGNNEEFSISDLSYQKISGNYSDDPYLKFFSDSIVIKNNSEKNNLVFYTPLGLPIGYFKDDKIHRFDRNVTRIFSKEKKNTLLLLVGSVIIELY